MALDAPPSPDVGRDLCGPEPASAAVGARSRGLSGKADPDYRARGAGRSVGCNGAAAAARLQKAFGQQVIIENRAGGNFQIGTAAVIASPPDGYTLLLGLDGPIAINPSLYPKLPYNPSTDLVPISGLAKADQVVIAHPSVPVKDIGELLALAKQKPGEITFAAFGLGSTTHLYMEMLQSMAGVKFQAVQYKGAAPMVADVVAGHVNVTSVTSDSRCHCTMKARSRSRRCHQGATCVSA